MSGKTEDQTTVRADAVKQWWTGTMEFVLDQWTLVCVAAIAACCFIAGLVGVDWFDQRRLATATLGLIAAMAIAMAKDRVGRAELAETTTGLATSLSEANTSIEALRSSAPYQVQLSEHEWNLSADGGATSTKVKTMRFLQDVFVIRNWSRADGAEEERSYEFDGEPVEKFASITEPGAEKTHDLVYLGRRCRRGDTGQFRVERTLTGSFKPSDYVAVSVEEPVSLVRMTVRWPPGALPVKVTHEVLKKTSTTEVDITRLVRADGGRMTIAHEILQPEPDVVHRLVWRV